MGYVLTFVVGLVGAFIFQILHVPMPWLLGSLVTVFILQLFTELPFKWSKRFRDAGLIIVGLSLGSFFTTTIFRELSTFLPIMIGLNVLLLLLSLFVAFITAKCCRIDLQTAIVASVPGGFSQLVVFAEEKPSLQLPIITYFHVVRVLLVVSLVPLLFHSATTATVHEETSHPFYLIIVMLLGYGAMIVARFIHVPVAAFLGPMLLVIIIGLLPMPHVHMAPTLLHIAQIAIGCHIGLSLKRKDLALSKRILTAGVLSALLFISFTFITTAIFIYEVSGVSYETAFLSLAPGGLDQMSLIALGVGGNVAIVTVFQLFRILVIYLCVLPLLQKGIK